MRPATRSRRLRACVPGRRAGSHGPGPLTVVGAVIAVGSIADIITGYGVFLEGVLGVKNPVVPRSIVGPTASALTGSEPLGDEVQDMWDIGGDVFRGY